MNIRIGQILTWIDMPDATEVKAQVIEFIPAGSRFGFTRTESDCWKLKLLETHPNGNRFRTGEVVFANADTIKL